MLSREPLYPWFFRVRGKRTGCFARFRSLGNLDVGAEADPELWRRFLALLLDGMRAPGPEREPLPGPPLDFARLEDVMCRWQPPRWRREA